MGTRFGFLLVFLFIISILALAQTTQFTYQGKLTDSGNLANGQYDFQFKLFDALSGGAQQGTTQTTTNISVTNGIFAVTLDFGACASCFNGSARFLEIAVKPTSGGSFTTLIPRQQLTSTPYAIKSTNAATADGLSLACVNCVTSSQIGSVNGSSVSGTIPVASVPAGSTNYIQNTVSQQVSSNFNISGDGTVGGTLNAGVVNATTQYNIVSPALGSSIRLIGISGSGDSNTFLGRNAAAANPTGSFDSFFGNGAGQSTVAGGNNSFFGSGSGNVNVSGTDNAFFGRNAGFANTASENAFFGSFAGAANSSGTQNAFFGKEAGRSNTTGSANAFLGEAAGQQNTTGSNNTFIGSGADFNVSNPTGGDNTLLGANARVTSGVTGGTAIGADAHVTQSNSLVLGNNVNVGIGTTAPTFKLTVSDPSNTGLRVATATTGGTVASFGGNGAFNIDASGQPGGRFTVLENGNVGVGTPVPEQTLHVHGLEVLSTGSSAGFKFRDRGSSSSNDDWVWYSSGNVARLFHAGDGDLVTINTFGVVTFTIAGGGLTSQQLCRNSAGQIAQCGSSLRYKQNIHPFASGLSLINRLRPVTFNWKANNEADLGLVAEEVAKVEPLLVTHNDKGEIEGVKYNLVAVVLLNAVKEQQAQLTSQQAQLKQQSEQIQNQQHELEDMKKIVCSLRPKAEMCKTAALTGSTTKKLPSKRRGK